MLEHIVAAAVLVTIPSVAYLIAQHRALTFNRAAIEANARAFGEHVKQLTEVVNNQGVAIQQLQGTKGKA